MSDLMDGFSFSVKASRSRASEGVTVRLELTRAPSAIATFFLSRDEAYALAHQLQHEADWLARLDPQPEVAA